MARDQVYIIRNTTACPNKAGSLAMAPGPAGPIGNGADKIVMSASSGER